MKNLRNGNILPQYLKEILIGVLLGDAHITKSEKNNAYIKFEQGIKNQEYLLFIYELFKDYAINIPTEYKRFDKRYSKENISFSFRTKSLNEFNEFADIFLKLNENNKTIKIVPKNIFNLLTPCSLAFWIMDDGQEVKTRGITQGITLCTDSFTYVEVLTLKSVLETKFGFNCSIHNKNIKKGYFRIYISKLSMPLLRSIVNEYMHSSMLYKIGL